MGCVILMAQLVIVFFLFGTLKASEPMCMSRFDYDEKMLLKILKFEDALEKFEKSRKDNAIAFTASGPVDSPFRFVNVLTNIGGRYYQSSGHFVCNVSGLYYFTFHLVKKRASPAVDLCQCNLGKNVISVGISAYTDPYENADIGSYGVSNGAYLRLSIGDTVQLVDCTAASSFESRPLFSGVLIKAD